MELSVHTVIMLFLAVYAYQGTCEVSPDFRLGSGAGATHSDSSFHGHLNPKYSRPRSSAEPMPIVAFALLWSTLAIATLMILWTYLVSWQDTASDYFPSRYCLQALLASQSQRLATLSLLFLE